MSSTIIDRRKHHLTSKLVSDSNFASHGLGQVRHPQLDGDNLTAFRARLKALLAVKPGAARMAETGSKKRPRA